MRNYPRPGIGYGKEVPLRLANNIISTKSALQRWRQVRVLMIDEISMIDGGLFDKVRPPPLPPTIKAFTEGNTLSWRL